MLFSSIFSNTNISWTAQSSKSEDHKCKSSDFPIVDTEIVSKQLNQMNVHRSMGPDGIRPRVLKELVNITAQSSMKILGSLETSPLTGS